MTSLPFRWFSTPGNRSVGRNAAIRLADADILASTDVSVLEPDWFERIIAPLERGEADVVSGWYELLVENPRERTLGLLTQWSLDQVRAETFLPSSRSVAFTRAAWLTVGGYPEDLATAEDTVFDLNLRRAGFRFVFEPRALVRWRPTTTLRGAYRMYRQFAESDGEAGIFLWSQTRYGLLYAIYVGGLALLLLGLFRPALSTYITGTFLLFAAMYIGFRIRKVLGFRMWRQLPFAVAVALAMDLARLTGYPVGLLSRRRFQSGTRKP